MATDLVHTRGDTFVYLATLGNGWTGSMFTGGLRFTIRSSIPASTIVTEEDSGVIYAAVSPGQISGSGEELTITIPASATTSWPKGRAHWDLQGTVTGSPNVVHTLDSGEIMIRADITRTP